MPWTVWVGRKLTWGFVKKIEINWTFGGTIALIKTLLKNFLLVQVFPNRFWKIADRQGTVPWRPCRKSSERSWKDWALFKQSVLKQTHRISKTGEKSSDCFSFPFWPCVACQPFLCFHVFFLLFQAIPFAKTPQTVSFALSKRAFRHCFPFAAALMEALYVTKLGRPRPTSFGALKEAKSAGGKKTEKHIPYGLWRSTPSLNVLDPQRLPYLCTSHSGRVWEPFAIHGTSHRLWCPSSKKSSLDGENGNSGPHPSKSPSIRRKCQGTLNKSYRF